MRATCLPILHPEAYFYLAETDLEKDNIFYLARVLGHALGIEERFNIFGWESNKIKKIMDIDIRKKLYPSIMDKQFLRRLNSNIFIYKQSEHNILSAYTFLFYLS